MQTDRTGHRLDPVLAAAALLAAGPVVCVAPWPGAAFALSWLAAHALGLRRAHLLWAVAALGVGALRGHACLQAFEAEHARARSELREPRRCAFAGTVDSSPVRRGQGLSFTARLERLDCEGRRIEPGFVARLYGGPATLARGDGFEGIADLAPVRLLDNFLLPDPRPGAARRGEAVSGGLSWYRALGSGGGPLAWVDRARAQVRARIDATYAPSVQALAAALVLGETNLEPEASRAFERSGLAHLLAVSGTHLVFAVLLAVRGLTAVLRRVEPLSRGLDAGRLASAMGAALAPGYAEFSGGSGSAWRAAFMLALVLAVRAMARKPRTTRVVGLAIAFGCLRDPLLAFDLSFALSVAALAGLSLVGGVKRRRGSSPIRLQSLSRAFALLGNASLATLGATLACLPLLLAISPGASLASVAANLVAAPVGELVALPLCLLHALSWGAPAVESGLALVAGLALELLNDVARATAAVEWLYVALPPPTPWHRAVLAVGVAGWTALWSRDPTGASTGSRRLRTAASRALALGTAIALWLVEQGARSAHTAPEPGNPGRLRVTALDVGQGDATLVDLPDGRLALIDGGGLVGSPVDVGRRVILPTLRARRRHQLDLVILTHPHPDHYGGLLALVSEVTIGEFWHTGQGERRGAGPAHAELLARLDRAGVRRRQANELCEAFAPGRDPTLQVLAPCPGVDPERGANDNSLTLRIRFGRHAALLTGDLERWGEERLSQRPETLVADFLKVGHHGSRTSTTPGFLARVRPRLASISCGVRNRFGHPHVETLRRLETVGARVLRLDETGAVEWQSDGLEQSYRTRRPSELAEAPPRDVER